MLHRLDAHGYHVNGVAADAEGDVHVELERPPSNDCTHRIERQPNVCNMQRQQLTGGLKISANDNMLKHGQMERILRIFVLADSGYHP